MQHDGRIAQMSFQYDQYLQQHKNNVKQGFDWIRTYLPELVKDELSFDYDTQIGLMTWRRNPFSKRKE